MSLADDFGRLHSVPTSERGSSRVVDGGHDGGVQVHLDAGACQGHNRCHALAPELFDVDEIGQAILRADGDVPADQTHRARLAASNCPEFAITITDDQERNR